ncbi:MAG: xanthine dehydrogenase family protein molybdopterin-binding subunit [Actinomycetota bacterium]
MSILGTRVVRTEDPALLTVGGSYVDDVTPADAAWVTFVRSPFPHATITGIDLEEAVAMPGVIAVLTADDLDLTPQPPGQPMLNQSMTRTWLATDIVRFVGEAVVAVITETREQGVDAAEMVLVDYEPLPAVLDPAEAATDGTVLFPEAGTNTVFAIPGNPDLADIFNDCEVVVELSFRNQRLAPCPLEPRAAAARWDDGRLTQWSSTQGAHGTRDNLAAATGVDPENVRVICPDVGGAFGAKNGAYPEDFIVALSARKLDRPMRWAETRTESMLGLVHGRAQDFTAKLGGGTDGNITAYSLGVLQDSGGYPAIGAVLPFLTRIMASGCYDIPDIDYHAASVVTNTVPVGAYRGAGRPEATAAIERMIDVFAAEIGMDPAEVRRRNVFRPEQFPLTTPTGAAMDSGSYEQSLDAALDAADYPALRAEQQRRRDEGATRQLGIGLSTYVEITNPMSNSEYGSVEILPDGSALAKTGSSAHGQGHHTTFAMLVADTTGIPLERIEVRHGDTDDVPRGGGTGGSKSLQLGGSAILRASEEVVATAKSVAADLLEANPDDVVLDTESGGFSVVGTPALVKTWAEIAQAARADDGIDLSSEIDFNPDGATFPFGTHVSVVEVDMDTGAVTIHRHIACDDVGTMINPLLVEGQVHGGLAQGIAQALIEEFMYDDDGNPVTSNFMDYGIISATELPNFERIAQETVTPLNPLGAKGVGESGTIGSTPAVQNAVVDALSHLGVTHVDIPLTSQRVWTAIEVARTGG